MMPFTRLLSVVFVFGLVGLSGNARAATAVPPGTLDASLHWTLAGSPYQLAGDVRITGTLTIDPGVRIEALANDVTMGGVDASRVELDVTGRLVARGTAEAPIVFTGPARNSSWNGIVLTSTTQASVFEHVRIEFPVTGVEVRGTFPVLNRIAMSDFNIGVRLVVAAGDASRIEGAEFRRGGTGVLLTASARNHLIRNAVFADLSGDAIHAEWLPYGITASLTVVNATIRGAQHGIVVGAYRTATVRNTIVTRCREWGLRGTSDNLAVSDSVFWANGVSNTTFNTIEGPGFRRVDPRFISETDLRPRRDSPCIDAGNATGVAAIDIAGNPRAIDGDGRNGAEVDIGAYEASPFPVCGDSIVSDPEEECDDGNTIATDGCTSQCRFPRCGDGFVHAGVERCDDGNRIDTDDCRNDCTPARCGDGVVWAGVEQCDDGNDSNTDECLTNCRLPFCGDGIVRAGVEECDDGNASSTDECTTDCRLPRCGDGFVHAGFERCDDGNRIDTDACRNDCTPARCGDGVVWAGVEQCDDGNDVDTDACRNDCRLPRCGDGVVDPGEACDDGNDVDTDACTNACRRARCGDGIVSEGEACDDGNRIDSDDCTNACTVARCGDGVVWAGVEECDDGNQDDRDDCTRACRLARCGDGFLWAGVEACDDGNADPNDGCAPDCTTRLCGDGVVQIGEACDDGNASALDACLPTCLLAACGDGFVHVGVEECDDGNAIAGDGCEPDCTLTAVVVGCSTSGTALVWAAFGLVAVAGHRARRRREA